MYHKDINKKLGVFIDGIQANLRDTADAVNGMKESAGKVFRAVKASKTRFYRTLLAG